MSLSTNSILHYTDQLNKLESILREGFKIKYCREALVIQDSTGSRAAHPMISFCDIPLSQSFEHFSAYGKYGVGLTKKWANRNGINPVLYLESNSEATKALGRLLEDRRNKKGNLTLEQEMDILRLKCFVKNYSGPLKRKDLNILDYRFYNEREWRLVPNRKQLDGQKFSITMSEYNRKKEQYNKKIAHLRFKFNPEDISYIIVEHSKEIPQMIAFLKKQFNNCGKDKVLDMLFSKVTSTEQILRDY